MSAASTELANLVVITVEHLPAFALGCYGNPLGATPHLDGLAATGARFAHCTVPCPLCVPSRVAFFTGQYPTVTGRRDNTRLMAPDADRHLPGLLTAAGYTCGLFGKNHCFPDPGAAGFRSIHDESSVRRAQREQYGKPFPGPPNAIDPALLAHRVRRFRWGEHPNPIWYGGEYPFPAAQAPARTNVDAALQFLEQQRDGPLFAWVSFSDAHPAYRPPTDYLDLYDPQEMPLPERPADELRDKPFAQQVYYHGGWLELMDDDQLRQTTAYYYAMVRYVDDCLGVLFAGLDQLGLADSTVVVATGDHGEYLGQHGLIRKTAAFYDAITQVPLIVRNLPGVAAGQSLPHLTEQIDLYPTLLELAGVPVPPATQGRSLMPVLDGAAPARDSTYCEVGSSEPLPAGGPRAELEALQAGISRTEPLDQLPLVESGTFFLSRGRMIRTAEWKYAHYADDRPELYDLRADPGELVNLAGHAEHRDVEQELRARLLQRTIEAADPR